MGLKESGLRGSLRNVSVGIDAIPDSVVYQWRREDFADPWPANVSDVDMTVNGLSTTNGFVTGDGTDDHGLADGPQTLPNNNPDIGLAFTFRTSDVDDIHPVFAVEDGTERFAVWLGRRTNGAINLEFHDGNDDRYEVETDLTFDDGDAHAVILNKPDDNPSNLDIFVDDMENAVDITVQSDSGYDSSELSLNEDLGFFTFNSSGNIRDESDTDVGIFEFNDEVFSESERKEFVSRRDEV